MSDGPEVVDAEIIDDNMRAEEAESLCRWAAARAGAIVVVPGLGPLSLWANDIYLIMKMGKLFGETLTQKAAAGLMGSLGAHFIGSTLSALIPFPPLQIPIAVGTTYGLGRVVYEWYLAGKPADLSPFKKVFDDAVATAKDNMTIFKEHPKKDEPLGDEKQHFEV